VTEVIEDEDICELVLATIVAFNDEVTVSELVDWLVEPLIGDVVAVGDEDKPEDTETPEDVDILEEEPETPLD